jgi:hypothetical protein
MFTRASTLRFAADDTPPAMSAAFAELRQAVSGAGNDREVDTLTEVFWAALHGLVSLARGARLRPDYESERLEQLTAHFSAAP